MGSACEGPTVARCLPCATAHYGPAVGPLTAAATALMRPWKTRLRPRGLREQRCRSWQPHPARPEHQRYYLTSCDEVVLGRAGHAAGGQTDDVPPGLPREEFLLLLANCAR